MDSDAPLADIPFNYSGTASNDEPALTVVEAVSWAAGVHPDELGSLHRAIDTDALNALFDPPPVGRDPEPGDLKLSFRYEGCLVTVEPGTVRVARA